MELKEAILKRTSVRNFTDEKVSEEDLRELVRRAGAAPSINNSEPWKFIAITNEDLLKELGEVVRVKYKSLIPEEDERVTDTIRKQVTKFASFFSDAPAVIAVVAKPYTAVIDEILVSTGLTHDEMNKLRNYPDIQTYGAAIQNILLTAVELNLGACWLTGPMVAKNELERILKIESPEKLIAFVVVGKPLNDTHPRSRQSLDEYFELRD
jgi:nitroreductase